MNAKKMIALLLTAVCVCALLAACGGKNSPPAPAADVTKAATIGEAMALRDDGAETTSVTETAFIYVFEQGGNYWRLTAALDEAQAAALWELDYGDKNYEAQARALVAPLAVTKCENLTPLKLSEEDMAALAGKTGADLINDGWTVGSGYNPEERAFFLEHSGFSYSVVFESGETPENTDDSDVLEAIKPLTVKSVSFIGIGESAADLPEAEA